MIKSKKINKKNAVSGSKTFSLSTMAAAVLSMTSGYATASTDGTVLPEAGEFSVGVAGAGYDELGTSPTFTLVGSNVGVVNINANAKAVLEWVNLGVGASQTLTFSDSHSGGSVVLNKVTTGGNSTTFNGAINASDNMDLIFVNPNGITWLDGQFWWCY